MCIRDRLLILQDFCVKSCNAVYGKACHNGQMCHFYLAVIDDRHFFDLFVVARIFLLDLNDEAAVDLLNDLVYTCLLYTSLVGELLQIFSVLNTLKSFLCLRFRLRHL